MSEPAGSAAIPAHACALMFEAHPDAHWLIDETGTLRHANRAALRLMGNPTRSPVGLPMDQLVADGAARVAELLRQGLRSTVPTPARLNLRTGGGAHVPCRCEIALLSESERGMPAMLWCRLLQHGVGNNQFEVLNQQIEALKREVARRQAAEVDMRRQSEWLETVLLGIAEGVVATDLQGFVLFTNQIASDMTGWPRALSLGRPVADIVRMVDDDELQEPSDPLAAMLEGALDKARHTRKRLVGRDGTERLVQVSVSPLMSETGLRRGAVLVLRSIDEEVRAERERRSLERQLRESQKMEALGTMAGGVAHDFNNIVAAILGNVELALADTSPDARSVVSLQEIRRAGRRARDLVQQILTFSRRQDNTRAATSLAALLRETQAMLRTVLPAGAELTVDAEADLPTVWANPTQIEQVLLNLMGNGLQALQGRTSGVVGVSVGRCEGAPPPAEPGEVEVLGAGDAWSGVAVRVQVSDNGCGMTPDTLSRMFEPFFTTKATGSGTGLGLAVVHGILSEHGAVLRVRSAPGMGTTFSIWLPAMPGTRATEEPPAEPRAAVGAEQAGADGVPHVLYVDDDESMAFLVQRFLQRNSYRVTTCSTPEQALQCLRSARSGFTLCITDYNMPGMSGLDLAREIKANWPDLPVAIASGYLSDQLRAEAPRAGVDELMYKPNTVEELCVGIERLLERDVTG